MRTRVPVCKETDDHDRTYYAGGQYPTTFNIACAELERSELNHRTDTSGETITANPGSRSVCRPGPIFDLAPYCKPSYPARRVDAKMVHRNVMMTPKASPLSQDDRMLARRTSTRLRCCRGLALMGRGGEFRQTAMEGQLSYSCVLYRMEEETPRIALPRLRYGPNGARHVAMESMAYARVRSTWRSSA
ncbi:hypothetical protein HPP92_019186 [Vanilla planifolia]|uniref:Uncharacterized protein n=1 Tax=Vanilla planifolia TaxID=51239 RepID=A0A835UKI0_VANPL|nr:hypothetical protein HPP92_019694 [Vanilla planifolia]KAG0465022.1 hypothetical protein HPP92_019186 [Vanilla planifolia]